MELDAFDRKCPVPNAHYFSIIHSRSRHFEAIWKACVFDGEGVVTRRDERIWHPFKHTCVQMADLTGLSVHESSCANDFSAEGLSNGLVSKADAKDWK